MHPRTVAYLEHDGKLLLVNEQGHGPQDCIMGRQEPASSLRFPTIEEVDKMGIDWDEERQTDVKLSSGTYTVVHGLNIGHGKIKLHRTMPFIPLPEKRSIAHFTALYPKL